MKIQVSVEVQSDIDSVWQAYTTPEEIMQWNAASDDWHTPKASVDLREGGQFYSRMEAKDGSMGFDFAGTYTEIKPGELLAYSFGERTATVHFKPQNGTVMVQVEFDTETQHPIEQQQAGWQAILNHFKRHVEAKSSC